ncbi:Hsp20/alpha crystallin family protein [Desulfovibrio inopinatus]|uniref:Hsp20/alpha crystallin family protein n=1 Tax=Desulfovibrio inopinatus TaxID=102109 RepID=UPI0004105DB5|nr:Hsp20/alpha crystallin family protein [Desulfovibrio inopinatus]
MGKLNWTPWMGIEDVKDEMDRVMSEALSSFRQDVVSRKRSYIWTPCADIIETRDGYLVRVELASVDRNDVIVEVSGKELRIYGERRFEKDASGGVYQMLERSYGPFARKFTLPEGIEADSISAVMAAGLLEVSIPKKRSQSLRRRIIIAT